MSITVTRNRGEMQSQHHTLSYEWSAAVVRRGQEFKMVFDLSRRIDLSRENIHAYFTNGKITVTYFEADSRLESEGAWKIKCKNLENNECEVTFISSSKAPIGEYMVKLLFGSSQTAKINFLVFFNPWCPDDEVYLKEVEKLEEYVLNSRTIQYSGSCNHVIAQQWFLGQFLESSISAVLMLINRVSPQHRGDVVEFTRAMSALVNSNDDNGVLMGKWDGNYRDGINPNSWTGSADILRKYARYNTPVKYGQCWVFAGVLCSVLRACGVPSRCITNFSSFHDKDGSVRWELYQNKNSRVTSTSESVWNYHAWVEGWMRRKKADYCGWQVLDSTPQERSNGLYCLGPCSKYAIKNGFINEDYDTKFVFAEVNADKVVIRKDGYGRSEIISINRNEIGKCISTKSVDAGTREDVTNEYKFLDDSSMEETIQSRVDQLVGRASSKYNNKKLDVTFANNIGVVLGEDFHNTITAKCKGETFKNIDLKIMLVTQTGRVLQQFQEEEFAVSTEVWKLDILVPREKILTSISNEKCYVKVEISAAFFSGLVLTDSTSFIVTSSVLLIERAPRVAYLNTECTFTVKISNPLPNDLNQTKIYMNSSCISYRIHRTVGLLQKGRELTTEFKFSPKITGQHQFYVSMSSTEIAGYQQSHSFVVQ